jgi:lysophospholipase L1-like esterase
MLGADGQPRKELFLKDGLHMTDAGYKIWSDLVMPHVNP